LLLGEKGENDFKVVQMILKKSLRKEIQKTMEKGQALLGQPRLPFGLASGPACPPPLSRTRTPALSQPATATWRPYAGDGRAAAGHLHPQVGTPTRGPRTPPPSILSPTPLPSPSAHAAQQQRFCHAPMPEKAPPLAADRTRAPSSPPRTPAHSPSPR